MGSLCLSPPRVEEGGISDSSSGWGQTSEVPTTTYPAPSTPLEEGLQDQPLGHRLDCSNLIYFFPDYILYIFTCWIVLIVDAPWG